jgi:trans-AT polyketide synthase, acyltransferase and oxidoreductase domains
VASIRSDGIQSGWWKSATDRSDLTPQTLRDAIQRVNRPIFVVDLNGKYGVSQEGTITIGDRKPPGIDALPLIAYVPPLHPRDLGSSDFKSTHNLRYAYVAGAMANGITSVEMVEAVGRAGMIGFFGAAGLKLNEIETAIERLQHRIGPLPFGFNLIHSPSNPELEAATVDLYLRRGIQLVSASAYLNITLPLVYYRVKGMHRRADGTIACPNRIIGKVSRVEVARRFLTPPPEKFLKHLVDQNSISAEQAALASEVPLASALTAEADSGGHTDNRPAIALLPTMLALRDEMVVRHKYRDSPCVGLGGGIATPHSAAAAFAMGAAYVLTGSINQSCIEAGTSATVRQMLAEAEQADVTMAPSADMFELGVKVQVLKRGTMFPLRAAKLYELYSQYRRYEDIPFKQREILEQDLFRCSFEEQWEQTKQYFSQNDPSQIAIAEKKTEHKLALVFRSYLGQSSSWAINGVSSRKIDYQIWCGPAMGAFNQWVKGTFLEGWQNRKTVTIAMNLLYGAAVATRINWLRHQGVSLSPAEEKISPLELPQIMSLLDEG